MLSELANSNNVKQTADVHRSVVQQNEQYLQLHQQISATRLRLAISALHTGVLR